MTLTTENRHLHTGIAGSLLIHGALLVLFVMGFSINAARPRVRARPAPQVEKEVVLLFPEQVLPPLPPPAPKPKPQPYLRTTQNEAVAKAPARPAFQSDRNTVAASEKAPAPDGTALLPTTDGIEKPTMELVNRDHRDGQIKDDALAAAATPMPQMRAPQPAAIPEPVQVAKAQPQAKPLAKMMEEMDRESARLEVNRLPLEVKKAETARAADKATTDADQPPKTSPSNGQPEVLEAVAKPAAKGDKDAFTPFTRTSAVKGTISNRGQNAADTERTPLGVFIRTVTGAVEKKWHLYRLLKKDAVTFGSLKVRFYVNKDGDAEDMRIISDPRDADPRMTDFTLRAIRDAEIPPIPDDLLPKLDGERVKIEYDVLIY